MVDNQRREEMQKGLNKIYEESIHPKKVKKLEPIGGRKKYHAKHDVSVKKDYGFKKATLPFSQVKLEEMITLSVLKGTRNSGSIKKMLHAPTLRLYAVKEIPLTNREVRIVLKEWIATWQTAQDGINDKLSKVYGTFWNVPEGCVSVVMEYMNAGSLENLLESVGALPEYALLEITRSLLESIKETHVKMNVAHGFIAPSQVLFDQTGKMKLNLGIAQRLNVHQKKSSSKSLVYHNNGLNAPFKY
jgi:serine/threonine protein kinase